LFACARRDGDARAMLREHERNRAADSASATGDESGLAS
jgi:hypothetical protein